VKPESSDLYLSAIYHLQERQQSVTTSALAEELGVSMASVSEMLRKLGQRGLVHYEPRQPVTLADDGQGLAAQLVRRHRLWEVFLVERLGMDWESVYSEACALEHATSEAVADALERYLDQPQVGMHGYPIPGPNGELPAVPTGVPLTTMEVGQRAKIVQVAERDPQLLAYLKRMALVPGQVVEVIVKAPFEGPITVKADGQSHAIAYAVADCLKAVALDG
jgi:DtxR family Mn-dependent transcriptional regulator